MISLLLPLLFSAANARGPVQSVTAAPIIQPSDDADTKVRKVLEMLSSDPAVTLVQEAALDFFAVEQNTIETYRRLARLRALLPSVSAGFTYDENKDLTLGSDQNTFGPFDPNDPQTTSMADGTGRAFSVGLSWTLSSLVFDSSQLDAYSLVGIHEDIIKEVTRLYFARQHNMVALMLDPPSDPRARIALLLRTQEIEGMLDAMTGGEWSKLKHGPKPQVEE